nr:UvrD-helicase domain-containing protein [bacterium]
MNFTPEQQLAITAGERVLLVSASAGSGKTRVLVERIVSSVLEGRQDVSRLLVATFTNAAAAELRGRLHDALAAAIPAAPPGDRARLGRQLMLLSRAQIGTLHHFYNDIIRRYFAQLGIDPGLRVLDEQTARVLRARALDEAFAALYEQAHPDFIAFADDYSDGWRDRGARECVEGLYNRLRALPDYLNFFDQKVAEFAACAQQFSASAYAMELSRALRMGLEEAAARLQSASELAGLGGVEEDAAQFAGEAQALLDIAQAQQFDELLGRAKAFCFGKVKTLRQKSKKTAQARAMRDKAKADIRRLLEVYAQFNPARQADLVPAMRGLSLALRELDARFDAMKRERQGMDFADSEQLCLRALEIPEVCLECRQRYDSLYIDEYQDINPLQERILELLSEGNRLFMVGDVKQSIYRFRQAQPGLFLHKARTFPTQQGGDRRLIRLNRNFRSHPMLLAGINYLFANILHPRTLELDYPPEERLAAGRDMPGDSPIALWWVDTTGLGEIREAALEEGEAPPLEQELEARQAVEIIRQWHEQPLPDGQGTRPTRWRDICVLLRAPRGGKRMGQAYERALNRAGIPCYVDADNNLLDTAETAPLLDMLRLISNTGRDNALIGVLLSDLYDFTLDELIVARAQQPEGKLADALAALSQQDNALGRRLAAFFEELTQLKVLARVLEPHELLTHLLEHTGYLARLGAWPDGAQRQANVRLLMEFAGQFVATGQHSVHQLLDFLQQVQSRDAGLGAAKLLGDAEDVVRIMSVHKSKGLEFPCVLVGGVASRMGASRSGPVAFHEALGIGPAYHSARLALKSTTPARQAVLARSQREDKAEEARLLYVALTRAQQRLALLAAAPVERAAIGRMPCTAATCGAAGSWLDWLCLALARHPDGEALRRLTGLEAPLEPTLGSAFAVHIAAPLPAPPEAPAAEAPMARLEALLHMDTGDEPLPWQQEKKPPAVPAKRSISSLLAGDMGEMPPLHAVGLEDALPRLEAMRRGTAYHALLERLPLSPIPGRDDIVALLDKITARGILTPEEAASIDVDAILWWAGSPLAREMAAAHPLREVPFTLSVPARQVDGTDSGEHTLLQGVIDACFETPGGWVLVDYKTNRVSYDQAPKLVQHYRVQLSWYARALKELTGKPVCRMALVALYARRTLWVTP